MLVYSSGGLFTAGRVSDLFTHTVYVSKMSVYTCISPKYFHLSWGNE